MIEPPAEDTALLAQVSQVLDDMDPERHNLHTTGATYINLAATLTAALETDTELSPELLSTLWLIWAGPDARLLRPSNRLALHQLTQRLEDVRPGARTPSEAPMLDPGR
jgi:hypothetical protein